MEGGAGWSASGLENRASRKAEGSTPSLSAPVVLLRSSLMSDSTGTRHDMEDTRPVRSHAANVVGCNSLLGSIPRSSAQEIHRGYPLGDRRKAPLQCSTLLRVRSHPVKVGIGVQLSGGAQVWG
jgi:hypothetical protein